MTEETPTEPSTAMTPITGLASSGVAIVGGLAATTSTDNGIATFGVCGVIGGLITAFGTAFYPWFRDWLGRQQLAAKVSQLETDFKASQERNHARYRRADGMLQQANVAIYDLKVENAYLRGQLGITNVAVAANAENATAIAHKTGTDLPASVPTLPLLGSVSDSVLIPAPPGASQSHEQAQQV